MALLELYWCTSRVRFVVSRSRSAEHLRMRLAAFRAFHFEDHQTYLDRVDVVSQSTVATGTSHLYLRNRRRCGMGWLGLTGSRRGPRKGRPLASRATFSPHSRFLRVPYESETVPIPGSTAIRSPG